jgi:DNA-binding transcriptional ArsR family regulator
MTDPPFDLPDVAVLDSTEQAAALLDPLRIRILHHLRTPDSAAGTARALHATRQQIGYHIRELTTAGLLVRHGQRQRGNATEQLLHASAAHYVIGPLALGAVALDPAAIAQDRFSSSYLIATAYRALLDVSELQHRAREQHRFLPTLTLEAEVSFASPERQSAFAQEIAEVVRALAAKYDDTTAPATPKFRIIAGVHPAIAPSSPPDARDLS